MSERTPDRKAACKCEHGPCEHSRSSMSYEREIRSLKAASDTGIVAALFVERHGVYSTIPGVDVWDEARDARTYPGPYPVVAHPPCARWSRLAGFTEARFGLLRGADDGCFAAAVAAVRRWGGVIEHPAHTAAFAAFGLPSPSVRQGWTLDLYGGASCYVEQGRYGLPVKKATWLYAYGVTDLPQLRWGWQRDSEGDNQTEYGSIDAWRDAWGGRREQYMRGAHRGGHYGLSATTPPEFCDVLLALARTALPPL